MFKFIVFMELYGLNWEVVVGWIMVFKDKEKDDN